MLVLSSWPNTIDATLQKLCVMPQLRTVGGHHVTTAPTHTPMAALLQNVGCHWIDCAKSLVKIRASLSDCSMGSGRIFTLIVDLNENGQ